MVIQPVSKLMNSMKKPIIQGEGRVCVQIPKVRFTSDPNIWQGRMAVTGQGNSSKTCMLPDR